MSLTVLPTGDPETWPAPEQPKGGRPSERTPEVEERIIDGLMDGMSLVRVCEAEDMPNRRTVLRWMEADEAFATRCARARTMQADLMDDKILDEAQACTVENAQAARVRISAYQWRASKLAPKKYGDKTQNEHSGPGGGPIMTERTMKFVRADARD